MKFFLSRFSRLLRNLTIADVITLIRVALAPVAVYFIFHQQPIFFATLVLLMFLTDILDGWVARLKNCSSSQGALLDSIADILTTLVAVGGCWYFKSSILLMYHQLISVVLVLYLMTAIFSFLRYGKISSFHTYLSKFSGLLLLVLFVILFFFKEHIGLINIVIPVVMLSLLEEFILLIILPVWKPDVKGLYWVLRSRSVNGKNRRMYFKKCYRYH